jgi:predicted RNA-binding Zn-ribbon protein involved in translation (DUF1610 family)
MPVVCCPDCGAVIDLATTVKSGDVVDCPNCAGHALRLREGAGGWSATLAQRVSCPNCDEALTLPEDARSGDLVSCCDRTYRLTLEFGAFAAEET